MSFGRESTQSIGIVWHRRFDLLQIFIYWCCCFFADLSYSICLFLYSTALPVQWYVRMLFCICIYKWIIHARLIFNPFLSLSSWWLLLLLLHSTFRLLTLSSSPFPFHLSPHHMANDFHAIPNANGNTINAFIPFYSNCVIVWATAYYYSQRHFMCVCLWINFIGFWFLDSTFGVVEWVNICGFQILITEIHIQTVKWEYYYQFSTNPHTSACRCPCPCTRTTNFLVQQNFLIDERRTRTNETVTIYDANEDTNVCLMCVNT